MLRTYPAQDGGLARVRLPGGIISVAAWRVLADAATDLGTGVLELTARGNVQLRGLPSGAEGELAERLRAAGLLPSDTHDRVRNIVASPLTGRRPDRCPDVSALVAALDAGLCAEPGLSALPGRFLFAVDDGAADVLELVADVTLMAAGEGYALMLGGLAIGLWLSADAAVAGALASARAFLAERDAQSSSAWRLVELADGPARVVMRVRPEARALDARSSLLGSVWPAELTPIPPLQPGPQAQRHGGIALSVLAPNGKLTASAARALAHAAHPDAGLRITPWRMVVLPDLTPIAVAASSTALAACGLVVTQGDR